MFPMVVSVSPKYSELKKFIIHNIKADMEKKELSKEEKSISAFMRNRSQ